MSSTWRSTQLSVPIPQRPRSARWAIAWAVLRRRATVRVVWLPAGDTLVISSVTLANERPHR